jgi:pimeloyl-ACP methyl ester carboxylesterase
VNALTRGSGRPIVFIHGWRLDGAVEAADFEPVFAKVQGWRRIYLDLPGMGTSPPDPSLHDMAGFLQSVAGFVREVVPDEHFAVAGTSAGGALARGIAHIFQSRVRGLLLRVPMLEPDDIARTGPSDEDLSTDEARDAYYDRDLDTPWLPEAFIDAARAKRDRLWQPARDRAARNAEFLEPIRDDPARYAVGIDFDAILTMPVLIVTGRQDARVGFDAALDLMPQYPRATLGVLDRAGHVLPTGDEDLFAALVVDWLRRMDEVWH